MLDQLALRGLRVLPKNLVSRLFGEICEVRLPRPMQGVVNRSFASMAGIDVDESERPPEQYGSLNDFFTRRLKPGARSVADESPGAVVSPVDGRLDQFGRIEGDTLIQAKGKRYRVVDLVDSGSQAERFEGGYFATLYLSPRDYHRIHSPVSGRVHHLSYIPGTLFPVNAFSVGRVEELFTINERLITYIDNDRLGRVGVVKVGATCVGRIGTRFAAMETNQAFRRRREVELGDPVEVNHGDELGVFNLGSTVVLLLQRDAFQFVEGLRLGKAVAMGERLGASR